MQSKQGLQIIVIVGATGNFLLAGLSIILLRNVVNILSWNLSLEDRELGHMTQWGWQYNWELTLASSGSECCIQFQALKLIHWSYDKFIELFLIFQWFIEIYCKIKCQSQLSCFKWTEINFPCEPLDSFHLKRLHGVD